MAKQSKQEDTPEPLDAKHAQVECAVLYDSIYGKHDDIILLDRADAEDAYRAGYVDTHPNAMRAIREAKG